MKTVVVTGGAGYVGSVLVHRLLDRGDRVICLDRLMFGGEALVDLWGHPQFHFHKCDIGDPGAVDAVLDAHMLEYPIDAIIHLAAIVGDPATRLAPGETHRTNWDGSVHLVNQAVQRRIPRFIFASTCSNYGRMADASGYVTETSPLAPVSLYAELKVKFEQYMLHEMTRQPGFVPTSLRFATVYGISHRMRFDLTVNEFTKELTLGRELVVFGEQFWRPYCHVADFSRAMLTVLDAPKEAVAYEVFNVGATSENYTKGMILDLLYRQIPSARIRRVEQLDDPRDYRVNFDKIHDRLGFTVSRTVPQGIREIHDVVALGIIPDPEHQKYYNIPHARPDTVS